MSEEVTILTQTLPLAICKKDKSASIAYSHSGKTYVSGNVDSDTHLLNITSEQAALALSTISTDYKVYKVVTLYDTDNTTRDISPLVLKSLIDHQIRTGETIEYTALNKNGTELFSIKNVAEAFPFYKPQAITLTRVSTATPISYKAQMEKGADIVKTLRTHAKDAITKNFPTYDSATGYGTALITEDGAIYKAGQYSAPDHRIGFHSEPIAIIAALMDNKPEVKYLGVISSKHKDQPCNSCGMCRQFISEICAKKNLDIDIYCFALENDTYTVNKISEYLPSQWSNLK